MSVCIPTYNFGAYIGDTLESILGQLDGDLEHSVEVVVLDGGSTDDTPAVIESLRQRYPALRYERRAERGGIDRDMARAVSLGRGEYCWIFCADDLMKPGSIRHVLDRLSSGCDLYLCGLTLCRPDMSPIRDHRVAGISSDAQFDLGSEPDRRRYFERAQTTTAFFSFAGSLIVRRSRWEAAGADEEFTGSLWGHVARILRMIPEGLRLHYIARSLLDKRTDNDSFMDRGIVHRYAIAIEGYHRLASAYFADDSPEARDIRRTVTNEFPPWILLAAKLDSGRAGSDEAATLDRLAATAYRDPTLRNAIYRVVYRWTPPSAVAAARSLKRRIRS